MSTLRVARHALLRHKLTRLRMRETPGAEFRRLVAELGAILAAEALRDLPEVPRLIDTPLARMQAHGLAAPEPCLVATLPAGLGMLEGARWLLPAAPVGHLHPTQSWLPPDLAARGALLLDPVLGDGAATVSALSRLRAAGATSLRLACLVAAPQGAARVAAEYPELPILAAALDEGLDEQGMVLPGLGDAEARWFG
jgi:uracil phosphoribosyltransferase